MIMIMILAILMNNENDNDDDSDNDNDDDDDADDDDDTNLFTVVGCDSYSTLSEADRAHSYVGSPVACDSGLATGWYRFSGSAGSSMRSSCVSGYGSTYRCKTHAGGWLNGAHPSAAEGEVSRTVCFAWSSSCCYWSQTIKVKNCGSYFIYYLSKPSVGCSLRYCGSA